MAMDRSWIDMDRTSREYSEGVLNFIQFAIDHKVTSQGRLKCPCSKCNNVFFQSVKDTYDHLICNGFLKSYRIWYLHGESSSSSAASDQPFAQQGSEVHDDFDAILQDAFGMPNTDIAGNAPVEEPANHASTDAKLSFIDRLYHIKCCEGWSNESFAMLLDLLREALPGGSTLPDNFTQSPKPRK